jgi:hypothetical protein
MTLTLLKIIQGAQAELGLPQAATVIGNSDATTTQMLALANRVLDELRRCNPTGWTQMQFEFDLVVPVPITTTGNLVNPFTNVINSIPSTTGILANYFAVSANSVPGAARVTQVIDANTLQMQMEASNTTALTNQVFIFSQDTFPPPSDFDWFQNRSMWDRTNRWELIGPDSPQIDEWHRSGIVTTGPRRHFRKLGPFPSNFRIWPPPAELTSPLQLVFEYMSTNAIVVHGGATPPPTTPTFAQYFANDDDIPVLDDQAILLGIKWMFWEVKGMGSYVTMQNRWLDYVNRLIGRDGAAGTLQLAKRASPIFISPSNVQDGFFPGPVGPNAGV